MEEKEKMDIDKLRNRGGVADIGASDDGAIVEMIKINERLIAVKEKSIYDFVLADTLDPERNKPNLPPSVQTKLLDKGANDLLVARTFLTAKAVFQSSYFPPSIDVGKVLLDMLDLVRELAAMDTEIEAYKLEYDKACEAYEAKKGTPGFMLPAITDMLTRCKTIFQKADHACQYLMNVIRLFYSEITVKKYYTDFEQYIERKYGSNDPFSKFLKQVVPFIIKVRCARNCFDHRKAELRLTGFDLQNDGSVLPPTIEMDDAGSIIPRQDLYMYITTMRETLLNIIENILPYLASKHIQPMGSIPHSIRQVPEEKRRFKMVKFGIWMPLGEGGYYSQ